MEDKITNILFSTITLHVLRSPLTKYLDKEFFGQPLTTNIFNQLAAVLQERLNVFAISTGIKGEISLKIEKGQLPGEVHVTPKNVYTAGLLLLCDTGEDNARD